MRAATLTLNPALDRTMYFDSPFCTGELNRCKKTVVTLGSKGINVSRFLKILGIEAPAYAFCGASTGEEMKKMLDAEGIKTCFVESSAPTRVNIKLIDSNGVCTEANESGGPVTNQELEKMFSLIEKQTVSSQYFFLGGSIPHPVDKGVYNLLIKLLKSKGAKVILDCDGEALSRGLEAAPYLIKPNLYELSQLCEKRIETVEEAVEKSKRIYVEKGVEVLCTMSEKGAVYAGVHGVYTVTSPQVKLRGFTGAGDSFLSAFIYTLENTGDVEEALKFASSAAAAKVELPGSRLPVFSDMNKYTDAVTVYRYE